MKKYCNRGTKCRETIARWNDYDQDAEYPPYSVEVPDDYIGPVYCSITDQIMDGILTMRTGWQTQRMREVGFSEEVIEEKRQENLRLHGRFC